MRGRVKKIYAELGEEVDAIVLLNGTEPLIDLSFLYVSGAESGLFEGCAAILWPDGGLDMIVSELEETSASKLDVDVSAFKTSDQRTQLLGEALSGVRRLGVNASFLTYRNLMRLREACPDFEEVDVSDAIESARLIKDSHEIERLREASRIASIVADDIPSFLSEGMTESESAAEISFRMRKNGASGSSFETIAAFGENSAEPHHSAGGKVLAKGETALFDFGAIYRKYCSDITRTFFIQSVTKRQERMYEVVRQANELAISMIKPGVPAREVDTAAREFIDATEFKGRFIHSLGHGVGLSVHDGGSFSQSTDLVLKENMILTVEPGVYLPGFGGVRIEDDVRITNDGREVLTTASKEITVV
jgi:Xaa-Pro dipeptidase